MFWLPYSSHTSLLCLTDFLPSLNLFCHSETDARFLQDAPKAVWSIPYVAFGIFPSLKQNFIAYRSSKLSSRLDCIFEIHQQWQSGFRRVYSNSCCSRSFEVEIIKINQSSHKMYRNNILNFQESATILNAYTKKVWKLSYCTIYIYIIWPLAKWVQSSPMVRETGVQSPVESYQRLKKRFLIPPCFALSTIRWGSRVKWSNSMNRVAASRTPRCSSYRKRGLRVTLD